VHGQRFFHFFFQAWCGARVDHFELPYDFLSFPADGLSHFAAYGFGSAALPPDRS
jgi:hypothetical protein